MIQSHRKGSPSQSSLLVLRDSGSYLPGVIVAALARASTRIRLDSREGVGGFAESVPNADAGTSGGSIALLRDLKVLHPANPGASPYQAPSDAWLVGGNFSLARLSFPGAPTCFTTSNPVFGYPSIYWACGNGSGLHIKPVDGPDASPDLVTQHGLSASSSEALDVWVR
jgi:hypothetical protein